MKTRTFSDSNYRGLYFGGNTVRIALDPTKQIRELQYPEFYDVKITSHCTGGCGYCYQSSTSESKHVPGITRRFIDFFSRFDSNQMPFQIAFGGGEPTSHPEFHDLIGACHAMGVTPNYTTNGIWNEPERVLRTTTDLCGGVAVSTHQHLEKHWRNAVERLIASGVHTNLHCIIGNRASVDEFSRIYREFTGKVRYFVLLPLSAQGRSLNQFTDWKYLSESISGSPRDIAFGANFHPYLKADRGRFDVSIYEPESMSAYLDLETMKVFRSSFSSEERRIEVAR